MIWFIFVFFFVCIPCSSFVLFIYCIFMVLILRPSTSVSPSFYTSSIESSPYQWTFSTISKQNRFNNYAQVSCTFARRPQGLETRRIVWWNWNHIICDVHFHRLTPSMTLSIGPYILRRISSFNSRSYLIESVGRSIELIARLVWFMYSRKRVSLF